MGPKAKHTGQSSHTCRMAAANGLRACRTHLGTTLSCSHDCDFQHLWRCQGESRRLKRRHLLHASTRARTATDRSIHCLLGSKAYSESSCEVIQLMVSMREDATSTCIKQVHTSPACRCHSASIAQFMARLPIASHVVDKEVKMASWCSWTARPHLFIRQCSPTPIRQSPGAACKLEDRQVGIWKIADDASVVVGSRLLCLGNSEHPKLTLHL